MSSGNDPQAFTELMPGFDFLRQFAQMPLGASATSRLAGWVAPTANVEELDKRIADLKAVQFWLEQNAQILRATVQALEVQKMTLAALQGMDVNLADIAKAFAAPVQATQQAPSDAAFSGAESDASKPVPITEGQAAAAPQPSDAAAPMADPLRWWAALTRQFQSIAANAVREAAQTASAKPSSNRAAASQPARPSAAEPAAKPAAKPANKQAAKKKKAA
jgi:hypothetical protein